MKTDIITMQNYSPFPNNSRQIPAPRLLIFGFFVGLPFLFGPPAD